MVRMAVKKKLCARLIKSLCFPASISPHTKNIKKHLHKHNLNYEYLQAKYCDRKYRAKQNVPWKKWKDFFYTKIQILGLSCFGSLWENTRRQNKNQAKSQNLRFRLIRLFLLKMKTALCGFNKTAHVEACGKRRVTIAQPDMIFCGFGCQLKYAISDVM